MDIDNEIEIRRALHNMLSDTLVQKMLPIVEKFYCKLFHLYDLDFTPDVIKQKRLFVAKATEVYIVKPLPKSVLKKDANRYIPKGITSFIEKLSEHVDKIQSLMEKCHNYKMLEEEFSKEFHTKNFSLEKELATNRADSLSDFAKAIEKIYNYKETKK